MTPRARPGHSYMAGAPLLFAHRGGARLAPENTMEAFRQAVEVWDSDILEMDVHRTTDGRLVVIHDATVDRTTDGTGAVAEMTFSELRELDAGHGYVNKDGEPAFRGRGTRIPLFEEVLEAFPGMRLNVDVKADGVMPFLVEEVKRHGAEARVLLACSEEGGRADRLGYPGPTSATRRQIRNFYLLHRLPFGGPYTPRTDALQIPFRWEGRQVASPRMIREAHRRNLPVHVWTVDDPEIMRELLAWDVDGIQSDRPDLLARVLHEEAGRPLPPGHLASGPE